MGGTVIIYLSWAIIYRGTLSSTTEPKRAYPSATFFMTLKAKPDTLDNHQVKIKVTTYSKTVKKLF